MFTSSQYFQITSAYRLTFPVAANRDRGDPHGSPPPTPPCVRITYTAVRLIQSVSPSVHQTRQPQPPEVAGGKGDCQRWALAQPPGTMGRLRRVPRQVHTHSPSLQLPVASSAPLLPKIAPQAATNPLLHFS